MWLGGDNWHAQESLAAFKLAHLIAEVLQEKRMVTFASRRETPGEEALLRERDRVLWRWLISCPTIVANRVQMTPIGDVKNVVGNHWSRVDRTF